MGNPDTGIGVNDSSDGGNGSAPVDDGNGVSGIEIGKPIASGGRIDPASAIASDGDGGNNSAGRTARSDKGRKRGKYASRGTTARSENDQANGVKVDVVTRILFSLHTMAAIKIPEMAITQAEAELVAKAYADVAEFYPGLRQTEKAAALTELLGALGMVYGTRLVAIRNNRRNNKTAAPENVTQFPGGARQQ